MKFIEKKQEQEVYEAGDFVLFDDGDLAMMINTYAYYTIVFLEDGHYSKDYEYNYINDLIDALQQKGGCRFIKSKNIEIYEK